MIDGKPTKSPVNPLALAAAEKREGMNVANVNQKVEQYRLQKLQELKNKQAQANPFLFRQEGTRKLRKLVNENKKKVKAPISQTNKKRAIALPRRPLVNIPKEILNQRATPMPKQNQPSGVFKKMSSFFGRGI